MTLAVSDQRWSVALQDKLSGSAVSLAAGANISNSLQFEGQAVVIDYLVSGGTVTGEISITWTGTTSGGGTGGVKITVTDATLSALLAAGRGVATIQYSKGVKVSANYSQMSTKMLNNIIYFEELGNLAAGAQNGIVSPVANWIDGTGQIIVNFACLNAPSGSF